MVDFTLNEIFVLIVGNILALIAIRWYNRRHPVKVHELKKDPDLYGDMKAQPM